MEECEGKELPTLLHNFAVAELRKGWLDSDQAGTGALYEQAQSRAFPMLERCLQLYKPKKRRGSPCAKTLESISHDGDVGEKACTGATIVYSHY
jgi:hypothetical protein